MYGHFTGSPRARATRGYSRAGRKKAEAGRAGKESVAFCLACETDKLFWIAVLLPSKLGLFVCSKASCIATTLGSLGHRESLFPELKDFLISCI